MGAQFAAPLKRRPYPLPKCAYKENDGQHINANQQGDHYNPLAFSRKTKDAGIPLLRFQDCLFDLGLGLILFAGLNPIGDV